MTGTSSRDAELTHAAYRAACWADGADAGAPGSRLALKMDAPAAHPLGSTMSALMMHGGLYTLTDETMMERRLSRLAGSSLPVASMLPAIQQANIPTYFFYNMVHRPYVLHSSLISYLVYPNRHLGSPVAIATADDLPISGPGKTFSEKNTPSHDIPAAFTFVGQFIDHDLTLNATNLLGVGMNPPHPDPQAIIDEASPFLDLDSVYGPRIDDKHPGKERQVPMKDGYFCLRAIEGGGYDVCRTDMGAFGMHHVALIGDMRNDENQIILQVHLLLMRLHNAIRSKHPQGGNGLGAGDYARQQTTLHWQSLVANEYLGLIVGDDVVRGLLARLNAGGPLVYRPETIGGKRRLRMAHEFAIGFRFGHSQLRSAYQLNREHSFRLFDSLGDGTTDLQGGKCLDPTRLIDWPFFLERGKGGEAKHPSNLIDREVNRVVFDLPESTIPDDVKLVSNLPFRNLVRSNDLGLCAGEDLAELYHGTYPAVVPLTADQVEPAGQKPDRQSLFKIDTDDEFRTPLWYYLLREAEVARGTGSSGRLGPLGAHLVAEVVLSAIWYAPNVDNPQSFLNNRPKMAWISTAAEKRGYATLLDIVAFVEKTTVTPPTCPAPPAC